MKHGGKMMMIMMMILSKCTHTSINIDRKSIINTSVFTSCQGFPETIIVNIITITTTIAIIILIIASTTSIFSERI